MIILFLIAMFHLSLYYCNIELFTKNKIESPRGFLDGSEELSETKIQLEKYLNELKQYDSLNKHG